MDPMLETLIHHATLAPSGHNTQPWRFSAQDGLIRIHPDLSRRLPVVDPDDHALYISLGCALENLVIAAAHHGRNASIDSFPPDEPEPCLRVTLTPNGGDGDEALFRAIPARQSNRRRYDGRAVPREQVDALLRANTFDNVTVMPFLPDAPETEPIIGFIKEGNRAQFNDPAFVRELVGWIRFSRKEVHTRRDGLSAAALGFPPIPRWLGTLILTRLVKPEGEATKQEAAVRSSSLLLLFIAHRHDMRHWVDVGRSFQRVALTATSLGIAHAHVNMPCEVEPIRAKLVAHLGLNAGKQPLLLIRFGYTKPLPQSPRRPLQEVMTEL
jgi:hypothetical protein